MTNHHHHHQTKEVESKLPTRHKNLSMHSLLPSSLLQLLPQNSRGVHLQPPNPTQQKSSLLNLASESRKKTWLVGTLKQPPRQFPKVNQSQ